MPRSARNSLHWCARHNARPKPSARWGQARGPIRKPCSKTCSRTCPGICAASARTGGVLSHARDEHDPGAQLGARRDAGARSRCAHLRRGRRLFRRRLSRHRRPAEKARADALFRYAHRRGRASSASPSAWAPMACVRWWRSSSPITSIPPTTRSSRRRRASAIARRAISMRRSPCARHAAAASSAARPTARAPRRCSPMSPASRR